MSREKNSTQEQVVFFWGGLVWKSDENCNTPRYRTPQAMPCSPIMKGIPAYSLLVKVARGVFQFGVLKQPKRVKRE